DASEREINAVADAKAWLLAVTRRKAASIARTRARATARESRAAGAPRTPQTVPPSHEELQRVREVVASLPRRLREVIVLTSVCGMTIDQAARAMSANRNTVAWRRREALDRLHRALSRPETTHPAPVAKAARHG